MSGTIYFNLTILTISAVRMDAKLMMIVPYAIHDCCYWYELAYDESLVGGLKALLEDPTQ